MTNLESLNEPTERFKFLLRSIVAEMVDNPQDVDIELTKGERTHVYTIFVHKSDLGKLIGKNGQNVGALRHILKCWLGRHDFRAVIDIEES